MRALVLKTQCISSSFLVLLEFVHKIELEWLTVIAERKQLVGPGDVLAEGPYFAGENTYREGSKIFASRVGMAEVIGNKLVVMPVKGAYIPRIDDIVLGRVTDIGMSGWQVDIYAPYPAMLPASETPMSREARFSASRST